MAEPMILVTPQYIKENATFLKDLGFCQTWNLNYQGRPVDVFTFEREGRLCWSEKSTRRNWRYFSDDIGFWWCWDGHRVYGIEAEIEMEREGCAEQNGYPARTLEEVKEAMIEGGYMEE